MLGKPERIVILAMTIERMNLSATAPCPWKSGVWTSVSSAPRALFALRLPRSLIPFLTVHSAGGAKAISRQRYSVRLHIDET